MFEIHHLKTWPDVFQDIWEGRKPYEVRVFDRDYKVNDMVRLFEYDPKSQTFSGRYCRAEITYVTPAGSWGLPPNIGVFAIDVQESRIMTPDYAQRKYVAAAGEIPSE